MDWMPTPSPPLHSLHASDPAHWQDAQPPKESHPDDDRVSGELEMFRESRDSWEENWFEVIGTDGKRSARFNRGRGLRRGDPAAPLLASS